MWLDYIELTQLSIAQWKTFDIFYFVCLYNFIISIYSFNTFIDWRVWGTFGDPQEGWHLHWVTDHVHELSLHWEFNFCHHKWINRQVIISQDDRERWVTRGQFINWWTEVKMWAGYFHNLDLQKNLYRKIYMGTT